MDEPSVSPRSTHKAVRWGWLMLLGVFYLLIMPSLIWQPQTGLDPSWQLALGMALSAHLPFGTRFLWTYGPLGFLHEPWLYPAKALWAFASIYLIIVRLLLIGSVTYLALRAARGAAAANDGVSLAAAFGILLFLCQAGIGVEYEMLLLSIALQIVVLRRWVKQPAWLAIAVAFLLGFGALIKSTEMLVAVPQLLIFGLVSLYRRVLSVWQVIATWMAFLIGSASGWLVAGQSLSDVPRFVVGTQQMALGYSAAMGIPGLLIQTVGALVLIGCFCVAARVAAKAHLTLFLLCAPLLFEAWKEGFVRHDLTLIGGHASIFFAVTAILAFILFVGTLSDPRTKWVLVPIILVAVGFSGAALYPSYVISIPSAEANYGDALGLMLSPGDHYSQLLGASYSQIRNYYDVPKSILSRIGRYPTDVLPWQDVIAAAYSLSWDPSPVPQTYSAYTPYLDRLNAAQLRDRVAPKFILWATMADIDGRYAPFDEPATWTAMLEHYKLAMSASRYVLLKRTDLLPSPTFHVQHATATFGEVIRLPRRNIANLRLLSVSFRSTTLGHVLSVVFRLPPVYVSFHLANGQWVGPYRIVPAVAQDGLFINEFIPSEAIMAHLFDHRIDQPMVITGIMFTTGGTGYVPRFGFSIEESTTSFF